MKKSFSSVIILFVVFILIAILWGVLGNSLLRNSEIPEIQLKESKILSIHNISSTDLEQTKKFYKSLGFKELDVLNDNGEVYQILSDGHNKLFINELSIDDSLQLKSWNYIFETNSIKLLSSRLESLHINMINIDTLNANIYKLTLKDNNDNKLNFYEFN